ncbi:MAG: hypothetical protein C00003105_01013 [ANME-2 cluster archaeon HR1]|nr:MAG: hypothetical protein C00003105_01013 [ANME-2 cluster archaeon HR1]
MVSVFSTADIASILPTPWAFGDSPRSTAVFINCCLILSGVQSGCAWSISATTPDTWGVAIEVPESAI